MSDLDNAMRGIEFRRSSVLLDEIPVGLQEHRRSDGAREGARARSSTY